MTCLSTERPKTMEKAEQSFLQFVFDDFKSHPELVIDALAESNNISILLKREGDQVFVYLKKMYSDEVNEILRESQKEYKRKKGEGYNRERAFQDFMEAQEEISRHFQ